MCEETKESNAEQQEGKKFNPEDILNKGVGKEFRDYVKSLKPKEIEACMKAIEVRLKKCGITDEQLEKIKDEALHTESVKKFFGTTLPNMLADAIQMALIASKILGIAPFADWSWLMVFFPFLIGLCVNIILPHVESK